MLETNTSTDDGIDLIFQREVVQILLKGMLVLFLDISLAKDYRFQL